MTCEEERWPRSPRWTRSGWTARWSPGPTPRSTCSRTRCTTARGSSRASARTRRSAASPCSVSPSTSSGSSAPRSSTTCRCPTRVEQLYDATFEVLESNKLDACYIRPLVFRGYGEMGLYPMNAPVQVDHRRVALGHLPGRGGHQARRARQDEQHPVARPHGAGPRRQGHGPVPQQHPRQDRGAQRRLRRGRDAHGARPRRRGLGREHLLRAQRRAHDAAAERRRARGHHPRHRHARWRPARASSCRSAACRAATS